MQRGELRRKDREMVPEQAWLLLEKGFSGRLGTAGPDSWPYVVPLLYIVHEGRVYFHQTAAHGHTWQNLQANPQVCFEVDQPGIIFPYGEEAPCETSVGYESVILFGICRPVVEEEAKVAFFERFMAKYADPAWERPAVWPLLHATTVYEITVERITGKRRPVVIADRWKSQFPGEPRLLDFAGLEDGALRIRPLQDTQADVAVMAKWLTDPTVLEFYEGRDNPFDEARIRAVYLGQKDPWEHACLVEYEGKPLGYVQFYHIFGADLERYGYSRNTIVYGMDQFIGEPAYWGRGIGTRMIRLVLQYLFETAGAQRVIMDPVVSNTRAVRAYEKCGFRKVQLLKANEFAEGAWRNSWQMEVTPFTFVSR